MDDLSSLISAVLGLTPGTPIERTDVNGLTVSTVHTGDMGPETALLDEQGTHPVERYASVAAARDGHARWVEQAKTITVITKLGYGSLVEDRLVTLRRRPA